MDIAPARALCRFIDDSPSPSHAAASLSLALKAKGFLPLDLTKADWGLAPGKWQVRRGAAVIAFVVRTKRKPKRFLLVGAHTDSPHLRLKPRPAYACEGCLQFATSVRRAVITLQAV